MGTSELHRTTNMSAAAALNTNRSIYPKLLQQKPAWRLGASKQTEKTRFGGSFNLQNAS